MNAVQAKQNVKAALAQVQALAEAIRSLGSVPSGKLYAVVMSHMSLDGYTQAIEVLKRAGLVKEECHLLTWIGPSTAKDQAWVERVGDEEVWRAMENGNIIKADFNSKGAAVAAISVERRRRLAKEVA